MTLHDFAVLVAVGGFAFMAMLLAAAIVELIGVRRLADWLRLDIGDEDDR